MRAYSEQINTLEAQVSAQTRTLDQYRTAGDEAQKAVDQAKATSDSYEKLLQVSSQSRSGKYSYTDMADALLEITRDSLGDSGKEMYDTLSDSIFPTACKRRYAAGVDSLESEDYDQAIEYLTKVVKMDESYNDGQAIYRLAQAYQGKGDTENAKTWYQKMVDTYNNSRYIEDAKKQLAILNGDASADTIVVQYQRTQKILITPIAMIILRIMEIPIILTIQRITNKITKEKDMRRSISFFSVRIQVIKRKMRKAGGMKIYEISGRGKLSDDLSPKRGRPS